MSLIDLYLVEFKNEFYDKVAMLTGCLSSFLQIVNPYVAPLILLKRTVISQPWYIVDVT